MAGAGRQAQLAQMRRGQNQGPRHAPPFVNSATDQRRREHETSRRAANEEDLAVEAGKLLVARKSDDLAWMPHIFLFVKFMWVMRMLSAIFSVPADCDEVYNYWEPLHLFVAGTGFQTWEYSPVYALRSYFYIFLHAAPFTVLPVTKQVAFAGVRTLLCLLSTYVEIRLCSVLSERFGVSIARLYFAFTTISTGSFVASTAFLPSSFSMLLGTWALAAYLDRKWGLAIFLTAVSALVGWPFAAVLGFPIVVEMLFYRYRDLAKSFLLYALASGSVVVVILYLFDSYIFGKSVVAPLNIVIYNVLGGAGPNLYGTEPWTFYFKNLFLNATVPALLAPFAVPLILLYIYVLNPRIRQVDKYYVARHKRFFLIATTAALWFSIFTKQAHKEERFMYPIYPHIYLLAAVTLEYLVKIMNVLFLGPVTERAELEKRKRETDGEGNTKWSRLILGPILAAFVLLSLSRTYSLHYNYSGSTYVFKSLSEHVTDPHKLDFANRNDPVRVCMGKMWYRFPSSFALPDTVKDSKGQTRRLEMRFIESEFKGILPKHYESGSGILNATRAIPTEMNDGNKEEPGRYVALDTCDYIVDLEVDHPTKAEPNFFKEYKGVYRYVAREKYLLPERTKPWQRWFYVPVYTPGWYKRGDFVAMERILPTKRDQHSVKEKD